MLRFTFPSRSRLRLTLRLGSRTRLGFGNMDQVFNQIRCWFAFGFSFRFRSMSRSMLKLRLRLGLRSMFTFELGSGIWLVF